MKPLTRRESEILSLIVDGCSNAQIGRRLGISSQTVKNQLSVIFAKLGVRNRLQLAVYAIRARLVE